MFIGKERMASLEKEGVRFILTYDFNKNHGGIKRVVEAVNNRLNGKAQLEDLFHGMVIAPDGGKREKTRYVLVGISGDYFYEKEGIKHLDFVHKSMGYKDEPYTETKVAKIVIETLKRLNLFVVEQKYAGIQVVTSDQIMDGYLII